MVRRLTKDEKAKITADFVSGEAKGDAPTVVSLARAFGVSRGTIYTVLDSAGIHFPRPRKEKRGETSTWSAPRVNTPGEKGAIEHQHFTSPVTPCATVEEKN